MCNLSYMKVLCPALKPVSQMFSTAGTLAISCNIHDCSLALDSIAMPADSTAER